MRLFFIIKYLPTVCSPVLCGSSEAFQIRQPVKRSQGSFGEKALYDTASVTRINQIKELQHSMAESHIIIQGKKKKNAALQCYKAGSLAASL